MLNGQKYRVSPYELCEVYHFRSPTLRPGFQPAQGGLIAGAAALYPEAWAYLQTPEGQLLCKTEAEWQALSTAAPWNGIGGVPWLVQDLAAGTLRLMDLRGMYAEEAGFDGMVPGGVNPDAIVNFSGRFGMHPRDTNGYALTIGTHTEAPFYTEVSTDVPYHSVVHAIGTYKTEYIRFDPSLLVRTANKVAPRAWGALACVYLGQPQGV